jgi:radical SAM PhpK family P-methyltransferase
MIDCLLIGYNETDFGGYLDAVRRMGTDHVSHRVVNSSFIELEGQAFRCMDALNHLYWEGRPGGRPLHSFDFLHPVITCLGTFLHRRGFSFDYVNNFHLEQDRLSEKLRRESYRLVAVTTTFYETSDPILEVIEFVRRHDPSARIVVGGPHIAYRMKVMDAVSAQYFFRHIGADYYVVNAEGQTALTRLLAALRSGEPLHAIDNIAFREGDRYVVTRSVPEANPLEDDPIAYPIFPAADLTQFVSLQTSKSCPFRCSFCDFPNMAGKYVYTPVEFVERELNGLRDLGFVTTLTFIDDTFNVPKKRFKELLRMMIRNRYEFRWNCFYRADHGDEECIELMAEAGCEGVFMGVESGSDAMLTIMNKTARQEDYSTAIPLLKRAGILTYASLIVGFPGETHDTVAETVRFLEEVQPDFFQTNIWYCHPATPIYAERDRYGIRGSAYNWTHNTMDAQTAADLVERTVIAVEGSLWLPYFFWNVFYLQRQGMTLAQMKDFVRSFNGIVKEKLVDPRRTADSSALLPALRRSCQFDRPGEGEPGPVEILTGARYLAAERFWMEELRSTPPADAATEDAGEPAEWSAEAFADLPAAELAALAEQCGSSVAEVLLAACASLVADRSGRGETWLLASLDGLDRPFLPLRIALPPEASFRAAVEAVRHGLERAREHADWGLYLLSTPERMAMHGATPPSFGAAFAWTDSQEGGSAHLLAELERGWPAVARGLTLALTAAGTGDAVRAGLVERQQATATSAAAQRLTRLAGEAARDPGRCWAELIPVPWLVADVPRAGAPAAVGDPG